MRASRGQLMNKANDVELLSYLNRFLPAWKDPSGKVRAITLPASDDSPLAINFHWFIRQEIDPEIQNLKSLGRYETTHTHCDMEDSMGDIFKVSLGEVLSQLPEEVKEMEGGPFYVTVSQEGSPDYQQGLVQAITEVYRVSRSV